TAELAFDADLAGNCCDLVGEGGEGVNHSVDRVGELSDFTLGFKDEFAFEIAIGDGRYDLGDSADLCREVRRHEIDVIGEILPRTGDALHLRLAAKLTVRADFARNTGDLGGKRIQLIDHRVDGVFQLEDFALYVDRDLARQIAVCDGCCHLCDVSNLGSEV